MTSLVSTLSTAAGVGGGALGVAMATSSDDCNWLAAAADVIPSQTSSATAESSSHLQRVQVSNVHLDYDSSRAGQTVEHRVQSS